MISGFLRVFLLMFLEGGVRFCFVLFFENSNLLFVWLVMERGCVFF